MKLNDLLKQTSEWLKGTGPKSNIVISSRVRLARNIDKRPFSNWANAKRQKETLSEIKAAVESTSYLKGALFVRMKSTDELDRHFLMERNLISKEHMVNTENKAVVISDNEIVAIMINEEDHLRLQVIQSGFKLMEVWRMADSIDQELSKRLQFAYSPRWGYLTSCPTNTGTGLRASCMLHLPALMLADQMGKVLDAVGKLGLTVRGLYGEGTQASGNFFQVSNQVTLGRSEEDIIDNIERVINQIVVREENMRNSFLNRSKEMLSDRVFRAYGTLKSARIITSSETIRLLSAIRLGVDMGFIKDIDQRMVNELFILTQPAHLQKIDGKVLSPSERDAGRADLIREKLIENRGKKI